MISPRVEKVNTIWSTKIKITKDVSIKSFAILRDGGRLLMQN